MRQAKSKSNLQVKSSAPSSYDHTISPDTLENTFQIHCSGMQHRIGHESHVASALNKLPRCQNEVRFNHGKGGSPETKYNILDRLSVSISFCPDYQEKDKQ